MGEFPGAAILEAKRSWCLLHEPHRVLSQRGAGGGPPHSAPWLGWGKGECDHPGGHQEGLCLGERSQELQAHGSEPTWPSLSKTETRTPSRRGKTKSRVAGPVKDSHLILGLQNASPSPLLPPHHAGSSIVTVDY